MSEIEITEADRLAAAEALGYKTVEDATDYRNTGAEDRRYADMCQAFARHRLAYQHTRAEEERAAVVKYLHQQAIYVSPTLSPTLVLIADRVERGDHLPKETDVG
jgi:hypothetical protein